MSWRNTRGGSLWRGSWKYWLMIGLVVGAGALVLARLVVLGPGEVETVDTTGPGADVGAGSPRDAVDRYVSSWLGRDFVSMTALTVGSDQGFVDAHESWARVADIATVDIDPIFSNQSSSEAQWKLAIEFSFINGDVWRYESDLQLSSEGGRWFIDWSPSTIHPDLGPGETLSGELVWHERGRILAHDGTPLTDDRRVVQVGIVPERVESVADVSAALGHHLGVAEASVSDALESPGVQPDWFLPMATVRPRHYREVKPYLYPVPGIVFRETTARLGPDGNFASHVLGRVGEATAEQLGQLGDPYRAGDRVGQYGLEAAMEATLAGTPGVRVTTLDPSGQTTNVLYETTGEPSESVITTLDFAVQRAAELALDDAPEPSALVALDIETSAIRGLASRPVDGFNRALTGRYPPGSTFKVVTTAGLLGEGLATDSSVQCPSQVDIEGRTLRNAGGFGVGPTTLTTAFALSCNTTFASLGSELGAEALLSVAEEFGFNKGYELALDVAGGQFPLPESRSEAAAASIGQARVLASPAHMASVAAAAASGSWSAPYLLASSEPREATAVTGGVEPLREMLRAVVTRGTGTEADLEGDPVYGKTGSAEFGEGDPPQTHAWFIGFREDVAFAVIVEGGGSGAEVAAPIAAAFLKELDNEMTVSSQGTSCAEGSWPTFQGTTSRSGCALAPSILEPDVMWRQEVGIQAWLNNPVISADRVYVGSAGLSRGSPDPGDGVYSVSLSDGRVLWRHGADNDVNGVAVSDGTVVATGDQGEVWALDADDGSPRWVFSKQDSLFFTNPLIVEDLVFVGSSEGVLYALDLESGLVRWTAEFDSPLRGGAASDGEAVYAVGEAGDVRAFGLDGQEFWREKLSFATLTSDTLTARVFAAPTVVGDHVVIPYVRDDVYPVPALTALDRYTGSIRWEASDPDRIRGRWGNLRSSPAVVGELLVFGDPTFAGLAAIGIEDGKAKWSIQAGKHCVDQWPSPVLAGERVVLPQADGGVYAFDHTGEALEWSVFLGIRPGDGAFPVGFEGMPCSTLDPIQASPAVAPDGSIVVGTLEGDLVRIAEGF